MAKQLREYSRQSQRKSADLNNSTFAAEEDLEDEFKDILSSMVNEEYIISVTGIKDLSKVEYISLQLDTKEQALYDLSEILPNLKHLVLDNSHIGSIRDLGTGLRLITSLSLSGCNLRDLDGIGVLIGLQELCLSDNILTDISPLTLHENLENLNLTNNRLSDLAFGVVLASCPKLRSLFLSRNPIERLSKYRMVVVYLLSTLEMLDGTPLDNSAISKYSSSLMDEAHDELNMIREEIEEELRLDDNIFEDGMGRKDSDPNRSLMIPIESSPRFTGGKGEHIPDTGSDLTHGSAVVLAGNMAAAMRKRRVGGELQLDSSAMNDDHETTLDVLDGALRAKTPTTRSNSDKLSFVAEGDITEIVLGSPQKKPQMAMSPMRQTSSKVSKGSTANNVSMSFDTDMPLNSAGRRPKSAFSGSTLRGSDKTYEQHSKTTTPDKDDHRPPSPRQRNSSRPQSAAVSPAEVNSLFNDRNLPFVVSRGMLPGDDDDESDEEVPRVRDFVFKRETKETPQDKLAQKNGSGSLVHQNMVRRFKTDHSNAAPTASSSLLKKPLPSIGDDFHISDDDSDGDEYIAVNHSERLRFMIAKKDDKAAAMNKSRQATLKKLQGQVAEDTPSVVVNETKPIQSAEKQQLNSKINSSGPDGTAVEKKLGFNLAGSLAAIDRWVQDVDSGEDESETEPIEKLRSRKEKNPVFSERDNNTTTENSSAYNNAMGAGLRPPTGKDKILSRDAIFHLCWNASEKRPDSRSSSRPTSGVRKGSMSSIGSDLDSGSVISDTVEYQPKSENKNKAAHDRRTVQADYSENVSHSSSKPIPSIVKSSGSKTPLPKQQEMQAVNLSDTELIDLLKKPPKTVLMLRTKASFQEFFRGIDMARFKRLLNEAYADIADPHDRESKISRRLSLLEAS